MPQPGLTVSAPGKIILLGEHAVVYGHPAIAVPVTEVAATCRVDLGLSDQGVMVIAHDLAKTFVVTKDESTDPLIAIAQLALNQLTKPPWPDLSLHLSSTIPIASGLGSGAAVSTVIVRALAAHFRQPLSPETISQLVYHVEKLHHGTPSGIDNNVVAFAQPIFFQREQPIVALNVHRPLTFVIGDTGVKSPTHKVVGDLRARRMKKTIDYDQQFAEIAGLVHLARRAI